ncbi:HEAT repeat domain-containing protein [Reyranella soli]|uniref:Novel STAND NTPase 3 domain-containing protein n=1 Tax=Reyranella soli TaxID=1230389 RepID=A0A512N4N7_9HYPH|nr:hypothetical protein [Reyranella soli]GEP53952.1 hypothetical protein RSO01_11180 [Reyranella soli]
MAGKGARSSGKKPARRKRPVLRDRGGPAKSRRTKPGNPGYAGYEYQISVTVWVALDLMLAKELTNEVVIEPPSDEDLEAAVRDPTTALLGLEAKGERFALVLQAKTRISAPWSAAAFADVLLGPTTAQDDGSRRRSRPLDMLEADPQRRYIFVTNEASAEALRAYEGEHLLDFPEVEELPPHVRQNYNRGAQASMAPRTLLLTKVTEEVLSSRIVALLEQYGHVPRPTHDTCVHELREEVRSRIKGARYGRWSREELLETLVRNGGSVAPTRDMDHYVRPSSFDKIKDHLDRTHAVVIGGPSGTGKTLTADILELELRRGNPPFDVVDEEKGPGYVRNNLTRSDPVLFHLRDPWGGNRLTPGADRWSGELPKLLESRGPSRKFLITSRSDVLQSAGHDLIKDLRPFIVPIEIEDYGSARLAEIYDRIAGDLTGHAAALSQLYRDNALKELGRPYEIKRFLVALARVDANKPRKVEDLLADSQIDAISRVIADQIAPLGLDGIQSAAVIWALLSARGGVSRDVFAKFGRRLRAADPSLRPDVDGLIDFLVAGQNLRKDGSALSFYHPRVEDGLRLTFLRRKTEAEFMLGKIVDTLVAWDDAGADWGGETGVGILGAVGAVENIQLDLAASTHARLDGLLERAALVTGKRSDFGRALGDLARFGSPDHPPSRLSRILIEGGPKDDRPFFRNQWCTPIIDAAEKAVLRAAPQTKALIERFIREVLPFSGQDYDPQAVGLLGELASGLQSAYWDALDTIAGPGGPNENIDVIVAGALASEMPDYEKAIERFARSEGEAGAWMKKFSEIIYKSEEHVFDAEVADRDIDEPSEQYFNAREGMKQVVSIRCQRDGIEWIANHPRSELLAHALSELVSHQFRKPDFGELQLLLRTAKDWARGSAWQAVEQHWDSRLGTYLASELARTDIENSYMRRRLVKIAAANGDLVTQLTAIANRVSPERRLELLRDVVETRIGDTPKGDDVIAIRRKRALDLAETYPLSERNLAQALVTILTGDVIDAAASSLTSEGLRQVEAILPNAPTSVSGPLVCLAAGAGLDVRDATDKLLSTGEEEDGVSAVQALLVAGRGGLRESLYGALTHKRYRVRREAFRSLAPEAKEAERQKLILAAKDHSADMRLAFARLMQEYRWPEAIDALVALLDDTRNFISRLAPAPSWPKFAVARAAARALGAYEMLPIHAVDALIRTAKALIDDPFVACAALSAVAHRDDERIIPMLLTALESPGLNGAPSYRPHAQAAAWAICDRGVNGRLVDLGTVAIRAAEQDRPAIAGPLLVAIGLSGGAKRDGALRQLHHLGLGAREAVVRVAAIASGRVEQMTLDRREQILLRLARSEELGALHPDDRSVVEVWSRQLDLQSGFDRFTAWIAHEVFQLPISGEVGSIRAFDLPDRIGVMTTRSLTPYQEEEGDRDDGT